MACCSVLGKEWISIKYYILIGRVRYVSKIDMIPQDISNIVGYLMANPVYIYIYIYQVHSISFPTFCIDI